MFYDNTPKADSSWDLAVTGARPAARSVHALTWLYEGCWNGRCAGRFVCFGGRNAAGVEINELWECVDIDENSAFRLSGWRQIVPNGPQPSPRALTRLVQIDPEVPNRALLFGGLGASTYGDTWILDLSAFSKYSISLPTTLVQSGDTFSMTATQDYVPAPLGPSPQITQWHWRRNGVALSPGVLPSGSVVSIQSTLGPAPYVASTTLTISSVRSADAGAYDALGVVPEGLVGSQLGGFLVLCRADANGDGVVNFADLNAVLSSFGQSTPVGANGDVNGDGRVDFLDLNIVLANYGRVC